MLDVGVGRRVRVDVDAHHARPLVDRRALARVPRERQRGAGGRAPTRAVLRLDGEEAARVVLEEVDAEDDDVAARGDLDAALGESRRLRLLLGLHVRLAIGDPFTPRLRPFDRGAELVAGGVERGQLLLAAEDGHRHRAVRVRAQIVVVEVDAVRLGLQLKANRSGLVRQCDLDEAATLVRIDAPRFLVGRSRSAGHSQREQCDDDDPPPEPEELHAQPSSLPQSDGRV